MKFTKLFGNIFKDKNNYEIRGERKDRPTLYKNDFLLKNELLDEFIIFRDLLKNNNWKLQPRFKIWEKDDLPNIVIGKGTGGISLWKYQTTHKGLSIFIGFRNTITSDRSFYIRPYVDWYFNFGDKMREITSDCKQGMVTPVQFGTGSRGSHNKLFYGDFFPQFFDSNLEYNSNGIYTNETSGIEDYQLDILLNSPKEIESFVDNINARIN